MREESTDLVDLSRDAVLLEQRFLRNEARQLRSSSATKEANAPS